MNKSEESISEKLLELECLPLPEESRLEAFFLPVGKFPVPAPESAAIKNFVKSFSIELTQVHGLQSELFFQLTDMSRPEGPNLISKNAPSWGPEMGMGIWPDREPPKFFKKEDFTELKQGMTPRPLMYQMMRASGEVEARLDALEKMTGLGAVLQLFGQEGWESLQQETVNTLAASITEELFLGFPFYVPLLEKKSLSSKHIPELAKWLCGATVYLREDVQGKGILIVSKIPLEKVFLKQNGWRDSLSQAWIFPIPEDQ